MAYRPDPSKIRVEIAALSNSPCEIAVSGSKNGDFTRGIADFGYFNPYFGGSGGVRRALTGDNTE